jgi:hypothetical protein
MIVIAAIGVLPATASASGSPQGPPAAPTTAPFQQCAAVYLDPSCGYLIDITGASTSHVLVDPTIGFYEGQDDILVGVQNDSTAPVSSIHVGVPGSGYGSFGFDGDGLCTPGGGPVPADCPFGPVGDPGDYWGPDAQLTPDPTSTDSGTVAFPIPLQPGQYTYFSLESPFSGATVVTGTQNDVVNTNLSDGTNTGVHLADPSPTAITDTATLAGPNVGSATGTIRYQVFSDPSCSGTPLYDSGALPLVSATPPPSGAFGATFPTNATYYVQASYSGNTGATPNSPAATNCGDETVTFGTPPVKPSATITTTLVGPGKGQSGSSLTVLTGTPVHDSASVTFNGTPQNGRITYYVYSDSSCSVQVPGVNLGSVPSSGGVYPPSATVTLPDGTYYFQAIYSGNQFLAGGKSPCTEVLTVAPPCTCATISAYLNHFHNGGSTRLEFNLHSEVLCTTGAGGCAGTLTVKAPGGAKFIDSSKAKNGGTGLKLRSSTAKLSFTCAGPCAATTVQPVYTLQWLALKKIVIHRRHRKPIVRTVPDPRFTPAGRAGKTLAIQVVETCSGIVTRKTLSIHFGRHGQVDYKTSDLNGDGLSDGRQLTDPAGFL